MTLTLPEGVGTVLTANGFTPRQGNGTLTALPSLIDASSGVAGYRERLTDPLLDAPTALFSLLSAAGIGGIRVASSSWSEWWNARHVAADVHPELQMTGGGPALTAVSPLSDRERWIRDSDDLKAAVRLARDEQVGWITVHSVDDDFVRAAVTAARSHHLRVALRGSMTAARALGERDLFLGLANLTRRHDREDPAGVLARWAAPDSDTEAWRGLLERGVMVTSELLCVHRNVFVKDSLKAPFLEENIPILPHVRHVLQMRRTGGYLSGRSALAQHSGLKQPSRQVAQAAQEGWERLRETACQAWEAGLTLVAASTSPQLTQVPGHALKEELVVLHDAGVPVADLLRSATDHTLWDWPQPPVGWVGTAAPVTDGIRFLASLRPLSGN